MQIEKITTREGFEALAPVWNALLERSAANTITLTHEWLTTWWDVFGADRELCILLVRDGAQLIGIAPLLKRRVSSFGLSVQRLEFLASGEDEADEICSDYLDFIVEQGRESEALTAIFQFLREQETGWDELLLKEIVTTSPTLDLLTKQCESSGFKYEMEDNGEAVYLPIEQGWDNLLQSFSRKTRNKIRQDDKAAQKNGYVLEAVQDKAHFEEAFAHFITLHQNLWTSRGQPGVFASEKFTRFHRELADKLLPQGRICLYVLKCNDQPHAVFHVFLYAGTAFYYQSGFAPSDALRSPGSVARNMAIRHGMESGLKEWDFLKAEPGSYKYRWSNHTRQMKQIRIVKPQAKETMRATAALVANELRKVKRALKR